MKKFRVLMATVFCAATVAGVASPEEFARAMRANDLGTLQKLVSTPAATNLENNLHFRPLQNAAIYGSAEYYSRTAPTPKRPTCWETTRSFARAG